MRRLLLDFKHTLDGNPLARRSTALVSKGLPPLCTGGPYIATIRVGLLLDVQVVAWRHCGLFPHTARRVGSVPVPWLPTLEPAPGRISATSPVCVSGFREYPGRLDDCRCNNRHSAHVPLARWQRPLSVGTTRMCSVFLPRSGKFLPTQKFSSKSHPSRHARRCLIKRPCCGRCGGWTGPGIPARPVPCCMQHVSRWRQAGQGQPGGDPGAREVQGCAGNAVGWWSQRLFRCPVLPVPLPQASGEDPGLP